MSHSCIAQNGPAITCVTSSTRTPSRAASALAPVFDSRSPHVSTSRVLFDVDGPVAFLTFNRPEASNAMTWEMYEALVEACDRVDADASVRVFVLRGAGGKAFVVGHRHRSVHRLLDTRRRRRATSARLDAVIDRLERVRAATIAQVQGVAAGGGCAIALACDLRVCTPDARFGVPVARTLGNCLSAANYARLRRPARAGPRQGPDVHRPADRRQRGARDRPRQPRGRPAASIEAAVRDLAGDHRRATRR